jgi:5-methylcytosine-specific restriction endonuclease McrA
LSQTYISAALRRLVRERARDRCEYCLIPESLTFAAHWIDHIIAEKHGGKTEAENLANSCILCNQRKGSDVGSIDPETGNVVALFHPRRQNWADHFRFAGGRIESLSPAGRATERLLQFNHADRVAERGLLAAAGLLMQ